MSSNEVGTSVNECVACGGEIPEGDHICSQCKATVQDNNIGNTNSDFVTKEEYKTFLRSLFFK